MPFSRHGNNWIFTLWLVCLFAAGTAPETAQPAPPPAEAPPTETKAPEEEMDMTDDDITAGTDVFLININIPAVSWSVFLCSGVFLMTTEPGLL